MHVYAHRPALLFFLDFIFLLSVWFKNLKLQCMEWLNLQFGLHVACDPWFLSRRKNIYMEMNCIYPSVWHLCNCGLAGKTFFTFTWCHSCHPFMHLFCKTNFVPILYIVSFKSLNWISCVKPNHRPLRINPQPVMNL